MAAIRHARNFGIPIAFTRQSDGPEVFERSAPSAWISGFEPKRSDMVFERQQPSCYSNQLFADVVSQAESFAIAGLGRRRELPCDRDRRLAPRPSRHLPERCVREPLPARCRCRRGASSATTDAIELFADVANTGHWLVATSQRPLKGHRYG